MFNPESLRLALIADDLTGALDAAAPFAAAGLRVRVATRPAALAEALNGADVVAVSTRSRDMAPADAARAVAGVLAALPVGVRLFKKVDSRLKGPIAAELSAFGEVPLLVVPALPEFGRVVRNSAVMGQGVAEPISIASVLGAAALRAEIPDVETPGQMRDAIAQLGEGRLIVGAREAAMALAATFAKGPGAPLPKLGMPMLICVGSTDPITLAQVADLRAAMVGLRHIEAPDGATKATNPTPGVTLLQAVPGHGASGLQVGAALAASLLPLAKGAVTLVLTGGATAEAALDGLALDVLEVRGDVLPGLPLSVAGQWQIVTKSGGFGGAMTLTALAMGTTAE